MPEPRSPATDFPVKDSPSPHTPAPPVPDLAARGRFTRLVMALGHRIGQPLLPCGGHVRLADSQGRLQLVLNLSPAQDCLLAVRPVCPIPEDGPQAATLARQLLEINADREVLGDAALCAQPRLGCYALERPLPLDASPAGFLLAIDDLAELGDALRASLCGDDGTPPHAPDMRLLPA